MNAFQFWINSYSLSYNVIVDWLKIFLNMESISKDWTMSKIERCRTISEEIKTERSKR